MGDPLVRLRADLADSTGRTVTVDVGDLARACNELDSLRAAALTELVIAELFTRAADVLRRHGLLAGDDLLAGFTGVELEVATQVLRVDTAEWRRRANL